MTNMYLKEFEYFNGEYDVKFNIIDINTDKMVITLAVTNQGKISLIEYDLFLNDNNEFYFVYGYDREKINIEDFEGGVK